MSQAQKVSKLPSPVDRLEREAKKAHRAQVTARVAAHQAHIDFLERPSSDRHRHSELANLEASRARRAWITAEDKLKEAQSA